jgi:hypothetical protein
MTETHVESPCNPSADSSGIAGFDYPNFPAENHPAKTKQVGRMDLFLSSGAMERIEHFGNQSYPPENTFVFSSEGSLCESVPEDLDNEAQLALQRTSQCGTVSNIFSEAICSNIDQEGQVSQFDPTPNIDPAFSDSEEEIDNPEQAPNEEMDEENQTLLVRDEAPQKSHKFHVNTKGFFLAVVLVLLLAGASVTILAVQPQNTAVKVEESLTVSKEGNPVKLEHSLTVPDEDLTGKIVAEPAADESSYMILPEKITETHTPAIVEKD